MKILNVLLLCCDSSNEIEKFPLVQDSLPHKVCMEIPFLLSDARWIVLQQKADKV